MDLSPESLRTARRGAEATMLDSMRMRLPSSTPDGEGGMTENPPTWSVPGKCKFSPARGTEKEFGEALVEQADGMTTYPVGLALTAKHVVEINGTEYQVLQVQEQGPATTRGRALLTRS